MQFLNRAASAAVAACALAALAACGGGGGGSSDNGTGSGSSGGTGGSSGGTGGVSGGSGGSSSPYVLFATDLAGDLAAFTTLSPAAGTTVTGHLVETLPDTGNALAYDAGHDELYVPSNTVVPGISQTSTLEVFAHASSMTAGAAPSRRVVLPDVFGVDAIVLDTLHDRLWVSGADTNSQGTIAVYDHASSMTGSATASRMLHVGGTSFALDAGRDILYVPAEGGLAVFANASTLNGGVSVDHGIGGRAWNGDLALDASRDTLYSIDTDTATLYVTRGVSTLATATSTSIIPTTITLPAGAQLYSVAVDAAHDRLYVGGQNAAYVIDNVSTLPAGAAPASMLTTSGLVTAFAFAGQ